MPVINYINCKVERKTKTYAFTLFILSESLLTEKLLVFADLNIMQMGIEKTDKQESDLLTI